MNARTRQRSWRTTICTKHCLFVEEQFTRDAKRIVYSQLVEQPVQTIFDHIQPIRARRRAANLAFGIKQEISRQIFLSLTNSLLVIECTRLCKIQPRSGVADSFSIFLCLRLRHVHGNNPHAFALSLIAYLCDLCQIVLGWFGTDGPEVNDCRMALCLPRRNASIQPLGGPFK